MARAQTEEQLDWVRLIEAERIVDRLVPKYHQHLETARIAVVGRPAATVRNGKPVLGTMRKVSNLTNALLSDEALDYVIEVALDQWGKLSDAKREALVDHELCHAAGQDKNGTWKLRSHDVEEFAVIIRRHGLWKVDLELFALQVKEQLPLPLPPGLI